MIVRMVCSVVFTIVDWLIGALGTLPVFPAGVFSAVEAYIATIIENGAGLLFFVIRPQTFYNCIDILFFVYAAEPLYYFAMWVIKKLPFLGIQ